MEQTQSCLNALFMEMIDYYQGDAKRIQHFVKVHSFAKLIAQSEGVDGEALKILEAAAYVHDIGIKPAMQKYASCNGKLQESEGFTAAREMLERLGFEERLIERVCYLVAHHHTYKNIDGLDYQILAEADFLVNIYEDKLSARAVKRIEERIFKTKSGKRILDAMFSNG